MPQEKTPEILPAMCLSVTVGNNNIILEYVTPVPKRMPADWDKYIRRQRIAAKPKTMLVTTADEYYNDVLKFKHGDTFLIENKRVILHPVRKFQIPTGEYEITTFKSPNTR